MKAILRRGLLALVILLPLTVSANTGPLEEGLAASQRGNYAKALRLWRPLAEQGDATAQYNLGLIYEYGRHVPKDHVDAMKWYRRAAEQRLASAQYNLGLMYANGEGVSQNYGEAVAWMLKAANQGHANAQYNLGFMFFDGEGVPQDYISAHMWFNITAAQGTKNASKIRAALTKRMTPDQIADAQRMAREWMAKHQR